MRYDGGDATNVFFDLLDQAFDSTISPLDGWDTLNDLE
jgi:hypothetical protein